DPLVMEVLDVENRAVLHVLLRSLPYGKPNRQPVSAGSPTKGRFREEGLVAPGGEVLRPRPARVEGGAFARGQTQPHDEMWKMLAGLYGDADLPRPVGVHRARGASVLVLD